MMPEHRTNVVITKLLEVLYRRGYDLEGIAMRVRAVNKVSDKEQTEVAMSTAAYT